jgi:predicted hydrocarbon binding protein
MSVVKNVLRAELEDFSSIVCMKAVVTGVEEALGEKAAAIALITAGRKRGKNLAQELDLVGKGTTMTLQEVQDKANHAVGKEGTRLCIIDKLEQEGEMYKVYTRETICSFNELEGSSRECTYTLGAIQGFLEALLGKRLRGKQTASVLRGGTHDVLEFSILG